MSIILEGTDNSGKSTLARELARRFDVPVLHPGPRPTTPEEETQCISDQWFKSHGRLVLDRVTCISTPAYTVGFTDRYLKEAMLLDHAQCLVIYCRPPAKEILNFDTHILKEYDDPLHIIKLQERIPQIIRNYDGMMAQIRHVKYDYTARKESLNWVFMEIARRNLL